tara:strand:+ start:212 stop:784 length:573 start_codon:yes stop_codon:yes gene_type:complete
LKNVKIKSIAFIAAVSLAFTVSASDLLKDGKKMLKDGYDSTGVPAVEEVRMPIHSTFKASVEIYEQYHKKAFANAAYQNFYKSVEGKDEAEVKDIFNALSKENQAEIMKVNEANDEISSSIGTLLTELLIQQLAFKNMNMTSVLSGLSMWDMPSALGAFKGTGSELLFINDSIGEIYRISEILEAQQTAV